MYDTEKAKGIVIFVFLKTGLRLNSSVIKDHAQASCFALLCFALLCFAHESCQLLGLNGGVFVCGFLTTVTGCLLLQGVPVVSRVGA